ncbi:TPA: hypothetical protein ACXNBA_001175 [Stenotrophomonas maltophilia]
MKRFNLDLVQAQRTLKTMLMAVAFAGAVFAPQALAGGTDFGGTDGNSASTDNIDIMHRVLQTAAVRNRITVDELTPEQWLEDFYKNRKGSGKAKASAETDAA